MSPKGGDPLQAHPHFDRIYHQNQQGFPAAEVQIESQATPKAAVHSGRICSIKGGLGQISLTPMKTGTAAGRGELRPGQAAGGRCPTAGPPGGPGPRMATPRTPCAHTREAQAVGGGLCGQLKWGEFAASCKHRHNDRGGILIITNCATQISIDVSRCC